MNYLTRGTANASLTLRGGLPAFAGAVGQTVSPQPTPATFDTTAITFDDTSMTFDRAA